MKGLRSRDPGLVRERDEDVETVAGSKGLEMLALFEGEGGPRIVAARLGGLFIGDPNSLSRRIRSRSRSVEVRARSISVNVRIWSSLARRRDCMLLSN